MRARTAAAALLAVTLGTSRAPAAAAFSPRAAAPAPGIAAAATAADADAAAAATDPSRRSALRSAALSVPSLLLLLLQDPSSQAAAAAADAPDLTTRLFNEDGSLRDPGSSEAATFRTVSVPFPPSSSSSSGGAPVVSVDGAVPAPAGGGEEGGGTAEGSAVPAASSPVRVSYNLPSQWGGPETGYLDKAEGVNGPAVDRVTTYALPGPAEIRTLDRASTVGVARALGLDTLPASNPGILRADLISGAKRVREGTTYYEFDVAVTPPTCQSGSQDDLGMGFCPYDSIVLLGAAVVDGRMYGIMIEAGRDEWKRGSADLKRARSSFLVAAPPELLEK
jgi:hypothetical protein